MEETNVAALNAESAASTTVTVAGNEYIFTRNTVVKRNYREVDPASLAPIDEAAGAPQWIKDIPLITPYAVGYVSRQIRSLKQGRSSVLTTRLGGDLTLEQMFDQLDGVLAPILDADPDLEPLKAFEQANAKKTSPMSVQLPYDQRAKQLEAYFKDPGGDVTEEEIEVAVEIISQATEAPGPRLRPLSLREAMLRLPKDTQWGLPYCVPGVRRGDETLDVLTVNDANEIVEWIQDFEDFRWAYLALAEAMESDPNHPGWSLPALMGWRGDLGEPTKEDPIGTKQRVVWMIPHAVSIIESRYYPVLTEYFKGRPGFAAWMNEEYTNQAVQDVLRQGNALEAGGICGWDASAFDQHVNERLEQGGAGFVQRCFQSSEIPTLKLLSSYMRRCGMVTPNGVMVGRNYNRPSGSGGTNFLDCVENLIMHVVVCLRAGASREEILHWLKEVMGDDALYVLLERIFQVAESLYAAAFGAIVNTSKQEWAKTWTVYLKRVHILDKLYGAASLHRVVAKGKYYEHATPEYWSEYLDNIRWIGQLETSTGNPGWQAAVDLYVEFWSPLHLGISLQGGPKTLWNMVAPYLQGRTLDEVLDREDWSRQYRGYEMQDPTSLKVVAYLYEKYADRIPA